MTKEALAKLTQRWKRERLANLHFPQFPTYWDGSGLRHYYDERRSGPALDYLNDLEAMHLLEGTLQDERRDLYIANLRDLCRGEGDKRVTHAPGSREDFWMLRHAEPQQCADAMLLTMVELRSEAVPDLPRDEASQRRASLAQSYRQYASQCRWCEMESDAQEWERKAAALERKNAAAANRPAHAGGN